MAPGPEWEVMFTKNWEGAMRTDFVPEFRDSLHANFSIRLAV